MNSSNQVALHSLRWRAFEMRACSFLEKEIPYPHPHLCAFEIHANSYLNTILIRTHENGPIKNITGRLKRFH